MLYWVAEGQEEVGKEVSQEEEEGGNQQRQRDDPVDARARVADHAAIAKQVYENNMARIKGEVVYKSLFPCLQG